MFLDQYNMHPFFCRTINFSSLLISYRTKRAEIFFVLQPINMLENSSFDKKTDVCNIGLIHNISAINKSHCRIDSFYTYTTFYITVKSVSMYQIDAD